MVVYLFRPALSGQQMIHLNTRVALVLKGLLFTITSKTSTFWEEGQGKISVVISPADCYTNIGSIPLQILADIVSCPPARSGLPGGKRTLLSEMKGVED